MRELDVKQITENVAEMCKEAAYYLPKDVYEGLKRGRETEKSPVGQNVLDQIIKNAEIARAEDRPYCQDTGMTIVFLKVGQDLHITGGNLEDAINEGIAKGYTEGYLRKSVVAEPLFNRVNTKNNTPGVIYTEIVPGDKLEITVAPKGFGSENKSGVKMLVPADGVEGVKKAVMDIILHASVTGLLGEDELRGIVISQNGETWELPVTGLFIAVGHQPDNAVFASLMELDAAGYAASGEDCLTKSAGVFVAGDCRAKQVRQLTTAAADGSVAALAACRVLDA